MAAGKIIDVDKIVDEQRLKPFNYMLLIVSFLVLTMDGYDISAAPAAGPSLVKAFGLTNMGQLTWVFSANNFGVLFGAPLFGYIGDRWGRKSAIIGSVVVFGFLTLCVPFAQTLDHLTIMRFLTGFGVGGVMANTIALNAELAPRWARATFIILMFMGNTFGGAIPPYVSATLVPTYGWEIIFWIGGIVPLIGAVVLVFVLPESIKYLALLDSRRERAIKVLRMIEPGLVIGPNDRITTADHQTTERARFGDLFKGEFALLTPLLWVLFIINLMVFYLVNTWTQTVLTPAIVAAGGTPAAAAQAAVWLQIGGTLSGLVLCRFVDKSGLKPILFVIALAIPTTGAIGFYATSALLPWIAFLSGFALLGVQFGINAIAGIIYPTHIRSKGVGFAFGVGRFGGVAGPLFGGLLISAHFSVAQVYMFGAAPLLVSLVICAWMVKLLGNRRGEIGVEPRGAAQVYH